MKKQFFVVIALCACAAVCLSGVCAFAESDKDMLICEQFETVGDGYYLRSAEITSDVCIGDNGSLLCVSSSEWNDFVTFKTILAPNKTYTVAFRYNFINVTSGAFGYVNIKSGSNVDDASYIGFDDNGAVTSFGTNYVGASFDKGFYRTTTFVTFSVGNADDYVLVFGSKGTVGYVLDDVTVTEGTEPTIVDSKFVSRDELKFDENFEGGYGVFDGIDGNFAPQGKLCFTRSETIDGKYSLCATSNDNAIVWLCGTGDKVKLAPNAVYTLLFRFKTDGAAKLCVAVTSDVHGQKSTLANFDEQGRLYSDMSYNVASYVTAHADDYAETRIIFTTPSKGNLQLRFGVRSGQLSVDNVRLYKNAADVSYTDKATYVDGGTEQPMLALPQPTAPKATAKVDHGKVTSEMSVVFDEFVLPTADVSQLVDLMIDGSRAECQATFDITKRTLVVTWSSALSKYKYVTLAVESGAFVNADQVANDKFTTTFFNGADDVKAFVDAWQQVNYGDEQTRKTATQTALAAYEKLSDKEYFAKAYEQIKTLADWYAQQNKPTEPPREDKDRDKKGCFSVVEAVGAATTIAATSAAVVACRKRKDD